MREPRHPFQSGWWRRYLPFAGGFLVASTLLMATYFTHDRPVNVAPSASLTKTAMPKSRNLRRTVASSPLAEQESDAALTPVEKFVLSESFRVGKADPDPAKSHARLKAVARGLGRKDMDVLKHSALNTTINNDRRFLSVYLLALSDSPASVSPLMSVALSPMTIQDSTSVHYAEELMIRTQALEGLARHDSGALRKVLSHQDNAFLADQTRRLLREQRKAKR